MSKRETLRSAVRIMVENGMSERDIARATGVSRTTVWQIKQDLKAATTEAKK